MYGLNTFKDDVVKIAISLQNAYDKYKLKCYSYVVEDLENAYIKLKEMEEKILNETSGL